VEQIEAAQGPGRIEVQQHHGEIAVGQLVPGPVGIADGRDVKAGIQEQLLQPAQHFRIAIHDQDVSRR
jgi:hypothetical protein